MKAAGILELCSVSCFVIHGYSMCNLIYMQLIPSCVSNHSSCINLFVFIVSGQQAIKTLSQYLLFSSVSDLFGSQTRFAFFLSLFIILLPCFSIHADLQDRFLAHFFHIYNHKKYDLFLAGSIFVQNKLQNLFLQCFILSLVITEKY